ncbi:hypothetical protein C8R45DRAFT_22952 [Mycena sanguinolenta]|nr:hypothetical protein C8R45DRAFT_22952 [Mycena sanguinolenta]
MDLTPRHPSASSRSNIYQSLQEIYPQRPGRKDRTSESLTKTVFSHDDTHGYLQEIYPLHKHSSPNSHSPIPRVPRHEGTHEPFRVMHAHRLRPESATPDPDLALRSVSPETRNPLRSTFRSSTSQRALNQVPLNSQQSIILPISDLATAAYFQANVSSRRKDAPMLNHIMSSLSSDSKDGDNSATDDPHTFSSRPRALDDTTVSSQNLPLMSVAASKQNWVAAAVRPERDEPSVHYAYCDFKRFACDICFKTFSQKVHMQTHRHTHTGETPHRCKYNCGESFGDPAKRTRHYKDRESSCFQRRQREE